MKNFYYGAHYSIQNGILHALNEAIYDKCNIIQIFLGSPISRHIKQINNKEKELITDFLQTNNIILVIHSAYIINLGKQFNKSNWDIQLLIKEMTISSQFSLGSVVHCGKYKDLSIKDGLNNMIISINYILDNTPNESTLIIETSSGQGSELCANLDELSIVWNGIKNKKRSGICIDTCHIFASGYDIRTEKKVKEYLKEFNKKIGINNIKLVQLNDSKIELGGRVDRHQELGKGFIGLKGIITFIKFCKKYKIPIILESHVDHSNELKLIRLN
jgi:deoxyribonuclease-4